MVGQLEAKGAVAVQVHAAVAEQSEVRLSPGLRGMKLYRVAQSELEGIFPTSGR